ncbi:hypothetical protein B0H13DRAFT_2560451 [Mycena leptocephala]|nr:hypothetical protein B0H13DRAFT_2560451 [Mycena leptocephala]
MLSHMGKFTQTLYKIHTFVEAQQKTPIAPSLPPTPDHALPVLAGPMREFIDSVGLSDLPPKDKRFDGKVEVRQLGRELHSLTQQTARMHAELQKYRGEGAQVDKKLDADIRRLQDLQTNVATNTRDLVTANDRLERVELSVNQTAATLTAIHEAVKTLTARFNAGALSSPAPPPAPAPAPPPVIPPPTPAVDDTLPDASTSSIMIGLLQQLVAKRSYSPDVSDDARNVRTRVDTPFLAPAAVAPALPVAPAPIVAAAIAPALPVAPAPVLTVPATAVPMAPAPVLATSTPVTAAPVAPAPTPALAPVATVAVGGANPPPALPAYDPAKEARLGPVSWGRNITGESATVIKTVLPSARAVMRNYRARRGPDQNTIVACFESAEIATWFIAAFTAARTSPYENVIASPNA